MKLKIKLIIMFIILNGNTAYSQLESAIIGGLIGGITPWLASQSSSPVEVYQFSQDSNMIDLNALEKMQKNLGSHRLEAKTNRMCYEKTYLGIKTYHYCFYNVIQVSPLDTTFYLYYPWKEIDFSIRKNETFLDYGFTALTRDKHFENSKNLAIFLNSAYHQVLFPEYKARDSLFHPFPKKTHSGFWLRGLVSMGWATGYVQNENPFLRGWSVSLMKWLLYALDGFMYFGVAATAIGAENSTEAWQNPLMVKLFHTGISTIFLPVLSIEVGETIHIQKSGFRFPRELWEER